LFYKAAVELQIEEDNPWRRVASRAVIIAIQNAVIETLRSGKFMEALNKPNCGSIHFPFVLITSHLVAVFWRPSGMASSFISAARSAVYRRSERETLMELLAT
jgi:hypothetical protein